MNKLPNRFPDYMQVDVRECPRYPGIHDAYVWCGDDLRDMPCPRCKGLRSATATRKMSEEELKKVRQKTPKSVFNPDFGKNEGVRKWS